MKWRQLHIVWYWIVWSVFNNMTICFCPTNIFSKCICVYILLFNVFISMCLSCYLHLIDNKIVIFLKQVFVNHTHGHSLFFKLISLRSIAKQVMPTYINHSGPLIPDKIHLIFFNEVWQERETRPFLIIMLIAKQASIWYHFLWRLRYDAVDDRTTTSLSRGERSNHWAATAVHFIMIPISTSLKITTLWTNSLHSCKILSCFVLECNKKQKV